MAEWQDRQAYPTTLWSLIGLASLPEEQAGDGALNRLLTRYYYPLLRHLEFRFHLPRAAAEDLLQGFITRNVLAGQCLSRADPSRGRFRTFLLHVLDNYVKDHLRARNAACRKPGGGWLPLQEAPEAGGGPAALVGSDPFDREWALTVLAEAQAETQRFYESKGRHDTWGVFRDAVLGPLQDGGVRPADDELARRHGFESARQASNAIITARRQFGKILRDVIARYAESDVDVDDELRELMVVLSR